MKILNINSDKIELLVKDKAFDKLRSRDSSSDKRQYEKEMIYVYNVCDYSSSPNREGITDDVELHNRAVEAASLPPNFTPDGEVVNAMKAYLRIRNTVAVQYISSLFKSMSNVIQTVDEINKLNNDLLIIVRDNKNKDAAQIDVRINRLKSVTENTKMLSELSSNAEKDVDRLKYLLDQVKLNDDSVELAQGGDVVTDSMRYD